MNFISIVLEHNYNINCKEKCENCKLIKEIEEKIMESSKIDRTFTFTWELKCTSFLKEYWVKMFCL
jgi:hypothetical protein